MGIFSGLTWPEPVLAINVGMKTAISLTIREINSLGEELNLRNPYLMVGKGHIRICADGEDNPPFTLKINSFRESKQYGIKTYHWTVFNGNADSAELILTIENGSVAIWSLRHLLDNLPSMRIVTDKRSY